MANIPMMVRIGRWSKLRKNHFAHHGLESWARLSRFPRRLLQARNWAVGATENGQRQIFV